jgi:hypothetical protein
VNYCNEWKTEECHECANTGKLQMTQFMIAALSYVTLNSGLRQFQATWYLLDWVCTLIWKYFGLPSQICNWWVVMLQGNPACSLATNTYLWISKCDLASYFEWTNSWFPFSFLTAKSLSFFKPYMWKLVIYTKDALPWTFPTYTNSKLIM